MTITVTNIIAGPFTATGAEMVAPFDFKVFTETEIEVVFGADRTPVDPSLYTVQMNKAVDGQALEGGSVTVSAEALDAGVIYRLVARPEKTQEQVFSDTGSRLRNLNEVADRATLRALRAEYDGVLEGASSELLELAAEAGAEAGGAAAQDRAKVDASNVDFDFGYNAPFRAAEAGSINRPISVKLGEVLSLDDYTNLDAALTAAGDRGRPVHLPANGVLNIPAAPVGGVFTLYAEGPYTREGDYEEDIGGKLVQVSGTGLLYDPFYIGQHPNKDGTFKFEEAFRALAPDEGTGLRTLSTATLAVSSPNGSNAAVFTSRSSDGGSIGSGFALASYVLNDKPYGGAESPAHGMWLYHGIAVRYVGAGTTFGMEPNVVNNGDVQDRTPYYFYADGVTASLWLSSGLPYLAANPLSMFIGCVYNGASAQRGIVFEKRALSDLGGGYSEAISVPEKHYFAQYVDLDDGGPGIIGATHAFGVTTYELGSRLTQDDNGVSTRGISTGVLWSNVNASGFQFGPDATPYVFGSTDGLTVTGGLVVGGIGAAANFTVIASATNVSGVEVLGGETGGFPTIRAAGPASRIPLLLAGKGGAGIKFSVDYPFAADDAAAAALGVGLFESYFKSSNFNALTVRIV